LKNELSLRLQLSKPN